MPSQLNELVPVTADANGFATFTFKPPPTQAAWVGVVQVPAAPSTAQHSATVDGIPWGTWVGQTGGGPFQTPGSGQLVVMSTGLVPGVQYVATYIGTQYVAGEDEPPGWVSPSATAQAIITSDTLLPKQTVSLAQNVPVHLPKQPTAAFPGARWRFSNHDNTTPVLVLLDYQDMAGNDVGSKGLIIPGTQGGGIGSFGTAAFAHPHIGDYVLVTLIQAASAAPILVDIEAVHHQDNTQFWMPDTGFFSSQPPGMLLAAHLVSIGAGLSSVFGPSTLCYGGPAHAFAYGGTNSTSWTVAVAAQALDGSFQTIAEWTAGNAANSGAPTPNIILPPSAITITVVNNAGAAALFNVGLTADTWRVG